MQSSDSSGNVDGIPQHRPFKLGEGKPATLSKSRPCWRGTPRGAGGMKGDAATVTSGHTSTAGALTHKDLARKMPRWGV